MRTDSVVRNSDLDQGGRDANEYERYGLDLVIAVDAAIRPWLYSVVDERCGGSIPAEIEVAVHSAIDEAAIRAHDLITELATARPETPLSGPLERLRRAVQPVTDMLAEAGVQTPRRDPVDIEMRPDDLYGIGPLAFTDLSTQVHEAGIAWGAAKAYIHTRRVRESNPDVGPGREKGLE